jgi:hypothetical protein
MRCGKATAFRRRVFTLRDRHRRDRNAWSGPWRRRKAMPSRARRSRAQRAVHDGPSTGAEPGSGRVALPGIERASSAARSSHWRTPSYRLDIVIELLAEIGPRARSTRNECGAGAVIPSASVGAASSWACRPARGDQSCCAPRQAVGGHLLRRGTREERMAPSKGSDRATIHEPVRPRRFLTSRTARSPACADAGLLPRVARELRAASRAIAGADRSIGVPPPSRVAAAPLLGLERRARSYLPGAAAGS